MRDDEDPEEPALFKTIMGILETGEETFDTVDKGKGAAFRTVEAVADVHANVNLVVDDAVSAARLAKKGKRVIEKLSENAQPKGTVSTLLDWGNVIFGEDSDEK